MLSTPQNGERAGSFGLVDCFSFRPTKLLGAFGNAETVVTDSEEIASRIGILQGVLTLATELTDAQMEYVTQVIRGFYAA